MRLSCQAFFSDRLFDNLLASFVLSKQEDLRSFQEQEEAT